MIKFLRKFKPDKPESQAGVTLLITILIMSGLVIIALTVGALSITELRASRAYVYTEPAINAAQTGAEDSLWTLKRTTTTTLTSDCTTPTTLTGSSSKYAACNDNAPSIVTVQASQPYTFYLYDPAGGGNQNISLCNGTAPEYTSISLDYADASSLTSNSPSVGISITRLDGTPVGSQELTFTSHPVEVANLVTCSDPNADNRMAVTLTNSGSTDINVALSAPPPGLLTFPTVDSTGCSGIGISGSSVTCSSSNADIYSRKLEVTVPR